MSKSKRKEQLREERVRITGNTPVSRRGPGKSGVAGTKGAGLARPRRIQDRHVLQILPKDDTVNSDVTLNLVTSQIDLMNAKVALRGTRKISKGGGGANLQG